MPTTNKLSVQWFTGVSKDDREDHEKAIRNSTIALTALKGIIEAKHKHHSEVKLEHYDTPSWMAKQAHLNGKAEAFREVLQILSFLD